ncbi:MAG TPA: hypothetical protein VH682_29785, partial [Gemmataceae bacterium]
TETLKILNWELKMNRGSRELFLFRHRGGEEKEEEKVSRTFLDRKRFLTPFSLPMSTAGSYSRNR